MEKIYSNTDTTKTFDFGLMQYMHLIYKHMGVALLLSGVIAYVVASTPQLRMLIFGNRFVSLLVQLSPLIFTFYFYKQIWSCSAEKARGMLYLFASLMGMSLSGIFLIYTGQSIAHVFLVAAITFGSMSIYGYRTKRDLTSLNSFLIMGLIGLITAGLLNIFLRSAGISFVSSCAGVLIFTLFTAYDIQNLKKSYSYVSLTGGVAENLAVIGSLELYLDFVNLFIYLLNLLGNRKE